MKSRFFSTRRYVLRDYESEAEIVKLCAAFGWEGVAGYSEDLAAGTPRRLVWQVSPGLTVNSAQDSRYRVTYLMVMSAISDYELEPVEVLVRNGLDVFGLDELLHGPDTATTAEEVVDAVIRMGIGAPKTVQQDFFDAIEAAANSSIAKVREAAAHAVSFTEWLEFLPMLEELAEIEEDESVRALVLRLIDVFEQFYDTTSTWEERPE